MTPDLRHDPITFSLLGILIALLGTYAGWLPAVAVCLGCFGLGCLVGWLARGHLSRDPKETNR